MEANAIPTHMRFKHKIKDNTTNAHFLTREHCTKGAKGTNYKIDTKAQHLPTYQGVKIEKEKINPSSQLHLMSSSKDD